MSDSPDPPTTMPHDDRPFCKSFALATVLTATVLASTSNLTGQARWTEIIPTTSPASRGAAMMSSDLLNAFLFGGNSGSTTYYNDLWSFDGTNWNLRTADKAPGSPPARRWGTLAYDFGRGELILFGGRSQSGTLFGDTWIFDGSSWSQKSPANSPSARRWAAMAYDYANGQIILFGGRDASGSQSDTWSWDGTDWQLLTPATSPTARGRHGMVTKQSSQEIVIFGGTSGTTSPALADMWMWDGLTWASVPATNPPYGSGSLTHGMTYDTVRDRIVVFGGYNGSEKGGTWEFDGSAWVDRMPATGPSTRSRPAMAYVPLLNKSIVFGGYGGPVTRFLGDTWEYQTDAPAMFTLSGTSCAGSGGTPTLTANTLPWIGDTFELEIGSLGASANPMLVVGLSNTTWTGGNLPFNLGGIGYPSCDLQVAMDLLVGGVPVISIPIPATQALVGFQIYFQAAGLGPGNQLGVSPAGEAKLGAR